VSLAWVIYLISAALCMVVFVRIIGQEIKNYPVTVRDLIFFVVVMAFFCIPIVNTISAIVIAWNHGADIWGKRIGGAFSRFMDKELFGPIGKK